MSLAYLDPGNLEADLQQGAYTGYKILWVLFWCTGLGLFLQILAARLGVTTGKDLASMCVDKKHGYSKPVAMALWVCTELAIVGSDIQEVVGSAIAFRILFGFPLYVGCLITALDTFTFLGLHAFGVRKLEAFIAVLIGTICVCFWITFVMSKPDVGSILEGIAIPRAEPYVVFDHFVSHHHLKFSTLKHTGTWQVKPWERSVPSSCRTICFFTPHSCSLVMWIEVVPRVFELQTSTMRSNARERYSFLSL